VAVEVAGIFAITGDTAISTPLVLVAHGTAAAATHPPVAAGLVAAGRAAGRVLDWANKMVTQTLPPANTASTNTAGISTPQRARTAAARVLRCFLWPPTGAETTATALLRYQYEQKVRPGCDGNFGPRPPRLAWQTLCGMFALGVNACTHDSAR
jgi:hypothetical protein